MSNKRTEAYCLSDTDVKRVAGNTGLSILKYPDLANFADWDAFMRNKAHAAAVLFLVQSENSGHWIAAFNGPKRTAHVWDPLGMALDGQRAQVAPGQLRALGEQEPQFGRLLATAERAGYSICVNHAEFQDFKPSVNTCGRWVGLRILHRNKTDAQFKAFVSAGMARAKTQDADAWITAVTTPKLVGGQMRMECADDDVLLLGGAMSTDGDDDWSDSGESESGPESEFDADAAVRGGTLNSDAPGLVHTLVHEGLGITDPTPASRNLQTRLLKDLAASKDITGAGLWSFLRKSKPFVISAGKLEGGARRKKRRASAASGYVRKLIATSKRLGDRPPPGIQLHKIRNMSSDLETRVKRWDGQLDDDTVKAKVAFRRSDGTRVTFPARKSGSSTGAGICGQIDKALRGAGILERKAETEDVLDDAREKLAEDEPVLAGSKRSFTGGDLAGTKKGRFTMSPAASAAIRASNAKL